MLLDELRNFASNTSAVRKWCLNRAEQFKNTISFKEKACTSKISQSHTFNRPSKILQPNKVVCQTKQVLMESLIL